MKPETEGLVNLFSCRASSSYKFLHVDYYLSAPETVFPPIAAQYWCCLGGIWEVKVLLHFTLNDVTKLATTRFYCKGRTRRGESGDWQYSSLHFICKENSYTPQLSLISLLSHWSFLVLCYFVRLPVFLAVSAGFALLEATYHNTATRCSCKFQDLIIFLLAFKSRALFFYFSFTHLPLSLFWYSGPLRVFFKTCVIDIEALIKCRHLWLTETMMGGGGEKKARGLASFKKKKSRFQSKLVGRIANLSVLPFGEALRVFAVAGSNSAHPTDTQREN